MGYSLDMASLMERCEERFWVGKPIDCGSSNGRSTLSFIDGTHSRVFFKGLCSPSPSSIRSK